jgi:ABC-type lipoprotein export system ATPase subunit
MRRPTARRPRPDRGVLDQAGRRTGVDSERERNRPMIKLRNVEKSFKTGAGETFVLRRISTDIAKGEFVTIMGPSGAGKSTLLSILGMLDGDWRGEFYLLGEPVHAMKPRARIELNKRYIGFVFQQYHLLDDLNVYENLEIPLSYRNVKRKERQAIVADTLDRFQIVGKKDLYPNQLSGGQQQLVAVARAIIAEPAMILADEPTGSLHSSQGRMIMELLKQLNREGTTIVQVTHNEEYAGYGDRIIQLKDGWIVDE